MDKDYRILGVTFLLIDFFVEIMADSFKNVLKRGYLDELISTCKHAMLVFLATALFLFTTQMADIYSRLSFYIMFPIYVTISYVARIALKSFLKKKGFGASKKSLLVIAPDAMLRDTLRTVEKSCIGYTRIVAASLDTDMKGKTICSIPIVANHDGIVDYACDEWVDEVLIPPCSEDEYPEKMADIFLEMGIANLYLVKEYFEQKSKTEEVWVAAGGLVNQLNGRLILELQANGSLRVDNQTVMKMIIDDVKRREENQ